MTAAASVLEAATTASAVPPAWRIDDAATLRRAVAEAPPGTVLELDAPCVLLAEPLLIRSALHLRARPGREAIIVLTTPEAALQVAGDAEGGTLCDLILAGDGQRTQPLLQLRGADTLLVHNVTLRDSEGAGFAAENCRALCLSGVVLAEIGLLGGSISNCPDLEAEIALLGIGRRGRAAGIVLAGSGGGILRVHARDVSGNAVTLRPCGGADAGPPDQLLVDAARCFRAVAVLGDAECPVQGATLTVTATDIDDCAVLLSNCRDVQLDLHAMGCMPALLDGRAGARDCRIRLATDRPGALEQRGASRGNVVTEVPPDPRTAPAVPPPRGLPSAARPVHEVADRCRICGWEGRFRQTDRRVRETFACRRCRGTLRYRAQAWALLHAVADDRFASLEALAGAGWLAGRSVFEPGQSGPLRPYLAKAGHYVASVYRPGRRSGDTDDGVLCQDLTRTSFGDAGFDLVVTSDVMEHVRRPDDAWAEIRRILRPGGWHVFSIPLTAPMPPASVVRVDTTGDDDRPILPPVYHGDGADGRSLVYTDFGADLLDRLAALDLPTQALAYPSDDPLCASVLSFVSQRVG
ncbi:MAG TPA: class I SAM-dependent methyltransferase [Acetobacteraceae bacterium]|nr:class I SAM-dependent methyltransferase [Acetobacteraceae bacterium]